MISIALFSCDEIGVIKSERQVKLRQYAQQGGRGSGKSAIGVWGTSGSLGSQGEDGVVMAVEVEEGCGLGECGETETRGEWSLEQGEG